MILSDSDLGMVEMDEKTNAEIFEDSLVLEMHPFSIFISILANLQFAILSELRVSRGT